MTKGATTGLADDNLSFALHTGTRPACARNLCADVIDLLEHGIKGNGHMMMDRTGDQVAGWQDWLTSTGLWSSRVAAVHS